MSPAIDSDQILEELLLPVVERLEKKDFDLPPLPYVGQQVLALTTDPDAHAAQLTGLIQQDPVLTAKLFQIANSGAYGARHRIESLQQAIAWLGLNSLAGTAFTVSIQSGVFNVAGYQREVRGLWNHALATGFYGKALAGYLGHNQDTAFLCGLLHAIGKPFVVHTVNQYLVDSATSLPWRGMQIVIKESYIEVGRQLADGWEFPDTVKEAINLHDDRYYHLATSPTQGAVITCLAKHLATHLLEPAAIDEEAIRSLPVVESLNISHHDLTRLLECNELILAQVETMLI